MRTKKHILEILFIVLAFTNCSDFEEVNTDPNSPTRVTSTMLMTRLLYDVTTYNNEDGKNFTRDEMLAKYISWTEPQDIDIAFNLLGRTSFSAIRDLMNASKMVELAKTENSKKSYEALSHFLRAYIFFDITMRVGDIPYSDALKGEEDVYFPKYDSQKDVILGILKELDEAYVLFGEGENVSGDFIYGGDMLKWRKAANVLELKILLNLYKKTDDADLNVKQRIKDVLNRNDLFESNKDNFQVVYSNKAGQQYPFFKDRHNSAECERLGKLLVDKLKALGDYRLFYYANPTPNAVKSKVSSSEWDAYGGVESTLPEANILEEVNKGDVSTFNERYEELPEGEPIFFLSYQEQNFILAEMSIRGLIEGDAKQYYEEGIRSSMKFVADNTPDKENFHHNRKITDEYISSYLNNNGVSFASNFEGQLEQIIWQKYITTFLQTPFNAYFEYRRTGIPDIPINPKSNRNTPNDKMPLRWMYPSGELSYNMDNVSAATNAQYGGSDDYMGVMWILK